MEIWYGLSVVIVTPGSVLPGISLTFRERTLIDFFSAGFDFEISNAIVIAIEMVSRIDRTLIEHGGFTGDDAPVLIVVLMLAQTLLATGAIRSVR